MTQAEKDGLILMREEEKLARDVYLHSFDLYGVQIFSNISNAEQTHMDRILDLLITFADTRHPPLHLQQRRLHRGQRRRLTDAFSQMQAV